jgi:hypothetical protein
MMEIQELIDFSLSSEIFARIPVFRNIKLGA